MTRIAGLNSLDSIEYRAFALRAWSDTPIKASAEFLSWLYVKNPRTKGSTKDLLIADLDGRIIGAQHRMRLDWSNGRESWEGVSLHDLYVDEASRSGTGLKLILQAQAGQEFVLAAGLSDEAELIFERLGGDLVELRWQHKRIIRPLALLNTLAALTGFGGARAKEDQARRITTKGFDTLVSPRPTDDQIRRVLTIPARGTSVAWTTDTYRWRFFDPDAPSSILVSMEKGDDQVGRAVITLGVRKRVPVARIVDGAITEHFGWAAWAEGVSHTIDSLGVPIALSVTSSHEAGHALENAGWQDRRTPPTARLMTRRSNETSELNIWGGSWDFGFDSPWVR